MQAHAHVRVGCDQTGRTVVSSLRSDGPLQLRQSSDKVYLVGAGAAPLGGDDLNLSIVVGSRAKLHMSSVAAMLAQPGASGEPSCFTTTIVVEPEAVLDWSPLPTISVHRSNHINNVSVELGRGAELYLVEDCRLGRWNEKSGVLTSTLRIEREGHALLHHANRFGDDSMGWSWPNADRPVRRVTTSVKTLTGNETTNGGDIVEFGEFSQASMTVNGLQVTVGVSRPRDTTEAV